MDIVAALSEPGVYGPAAGRVELRETHVSWVFLAGDRALKVKKPVTLPFLDQGTLERRRAACEAEVRLNRRLAPEVYLGVRAVVPGPGGSVRLAAPEAPGAVEYAVEMRRFRDEDTLAAGVAAGRVEDRTLRALGRWLARFHAAAPAVEGSAEEVKRALDDSFASVWALGGGGGDVVALERFAAAFLATRWSELDARAAAGLVRDGHGDLRAEHILLDGQGFAAVDCVEFSDRLRRLDVGADLSFLVMDLHRLGRPDLATALVAGYRQAGGDPGDDALIAFHAMCRALIRAKVALFTSVTSVDEAASLISLAGRLAWRARGPIIIAVAGVAASGKSTLARALAAASGLVRLDSDVVRKELAGVPAGERAPQSAYSAVRDRGTYAELARRASSVAEEGSGAIVEATFRTRSQRRALLQAAARAGARVVFVECVVPAGVLMARAAARLRQGGDVSDAGPEVVAAQLAQREPFDEIPAAGHVRLRADRSVEDLVAAVGDALDQALCSGDAGARATVAA